MNPPGTHDDDVINKVSLVTATPSTLAQLILINDNRLINSTSGCGINNNEIKTSHWGEFLLSPTAVRNFLTCS